jgi:hypothetical protein
VSKGEGSPGSCEAEGEGGEGFYIGRRTDLLVISGGRKRLYDVAGVVEDPLTCRTSVIAGKMYLPSASPPSQQHLLLYRSSSQICHD